MSETTRLRKRVGGNIRIMRRTRVNLKKHGQQKSSNLVLFVDELFQNRWLHFKHILEKG